MCPSACISVTYFSSVIEIPQVCRNINRVKICMETGRTVILLNLENLYESLYDALNQVSLVKLTSGEYCWLRLVDTQLLWQCYHDATHGQLEDKRKKSWLRFVFRKNRSRNQYVINCRIPTRETLGKIAKEPVLFLAKWFRNSWSPKHRNMCDMCEICAICAITQN